MSRGPTPKARSKFERATEPAAGSAPAGLAARGLAVRLIAGVLHDKRSLQQLLAEASAGPPYADLPARDRALARAIAAAVLRRQGELEHVLDAFLERPLPKEAGRVRLILLAGAAQLVGLGMAPHAVVDLAVEQTRRERNGERYAKLTNAVLRRVAAEGAARLADQDALRLDVPDWLWRRWTGTYGADTGRRIAEASLREAALDICVKGNDAQGWAERLGGRLLPTGTIRLSPHGRIEELPGYAEGAWWVQDAAAALIARIAGNVAGRTVADLCAAPGGKTAGLTAAGARVTAVDLSPARLERLRENLQRLALSAEVVAADAATWAPDRTFDIVVLDAPCTATGTIRRHPDVLRLKRPGDVARLAELQRALLANAASLVAPGGRLVYATCSLEPEEGEAQIADFLAANPTFARAPIAAAEIGAEADWITAAGELRSLPFHLRLEPEELSGIDGFFVARLTRIS